MEMKPVTSSNIEAVGYEADKKELHVKFLNQTVYRYLNVPESEYHNLLGAESVGKYLNSHIKPAYQFERIS